MPTNTISYLALSAREDKKSLTVRPYNLLSKAKRSLMSPLHIFNFIQQGPNLRLFQVSRKEREVCPHCEVLLNNPESSTYIHLKLDLWTPHWTIISFASKWIMGLDVCHATLSVLVSQYQNSGSWKRSPNEAALAKSQRTW